MLQTRGLSYLIVAITILAAVCLLHLNDWFLSDDYVLIGRISQRGIYTSWGGIQVGSSGHSQCCPSGLTTASGD